MTWSDETPDETTHLAQRLIHAVEQFGRVITARGPDPMMDMWQLNANQMRAMAFIFREPGIRQKELAEKLKLTAAAVSVSIQKLIERDLVEKRPDEDDGRVARLYVGPQGQRLLRDMELGRVQLIAEILSGVSPDEQRTLVDIFERALIAREQALRHAQDKAKAD